MQQFVVLKANRMGEETWTTRVLTVDTANHILYLSQRGNVESIDHHCMVQIKNVKWWPHYSGLWHSAAYFLGDAPLSFCIKGSTFSNGVTSSLSRVFHLRTRPITVAERAAVKRSYAAMAQDCSLDKMVTPGKVYYNEEWLLRCMTREDIDPLLAALRSAAMDPSCVKGAIQARQPMQEPKMPAPSTVQTGY